jgi:hypothetical protein
MVSRGFLLIFYFGLLDEDEQPSQVTSAAFIETLPLCADLGENLSDLSLVQSNGNVRKSEELVQGRMDEFGEGRGGKQGDGAKPPFPVKGEHAAHGTEIANHALHPVMLQTLSQLRRTMPREPASLRASASVRHQSASCCAS